MERYTPFCAAEAMYGLRQVRQTGMVRDSFDRFNEALADCVEMSETEALQTSIEGLHPGIGRSVHMSQPMCLPDPIRVAVYMYADMEAIVGHRSL